MNREALAGIRIALCVAKADGKLTAEEEAALQGLLSNFPEDERPTLDSLLSEDISLEEELTHLSSDESRKRVADAARLIAGADGETSDAELALIERIVPFTGEPTLIGQILGEAKDTFLPSRIPTIHDPAQRSVEIQEDLLKFSILAAVLGANPLPAVAVVTDLAVVGLQVKLVRDVGQYFGHRIDNQAARSLLAAASGSVVLRIALSNLARFIPGWGSVASAAAAFASTWALGKVAERWFAQGGGLDPELLRATYEEAWKEGRRSYDAEKEKVEQAKRHHATALQRLQEDLSAGRITQEHYEEAVTSLGQFKG